MTWKHEGASGGISGADPRREMLRAITRHRDIVLLCFVATTVLAVWRTHVFPHSGEERLRGGAIIEFSLPLSVDWGSEATRSAACYVEVHAIDVERAETIASGGFAAFMRSRPEGLRTELPPVKVFPMGGRVRWSFFLVMSLLGLFLGVLVAVAIEDRRKRRRLKAAAAGCQLPAEGGEAATLSPDGRVLFAALGPLRHIIWATVLVSVGAVYLYTRHLEARDVERGRNWKAAVELSFPSTSGESEGPEAGALIEAIAGDPEDAREVVRALAAAYLSVAESAREQRTIAKETVARRAHLGWMQLLAVAALGLSFGTGIAFLATAVRRFLRRQGGGRASQAHTPLGR